MILPRNIHAQHNIPLKGDDVALRVTLRYVAQHVTLYVNIICLSVTSLIALRNMLRGGNTCHEM